VIAAARQRVRIVVTAANANELVDAVVVRSDVLVRNGPGNFPAITLRALEIQIGESQRDAAPNVGLAADSPNAPEIERFFGRGEVGLFLGTQPERWWLLAALYPFPPFIRRDMSPKVFPVEMCARVQHQDSGTLVRQVPGSHAA